MPVELQALWTLHGAPHGPNSIYFHGHPAGAGALTDAIAQQLNLADRSLADVPPRARRAAEVVWREVIDRSIPAGPIHLEGMQIPITGPEHVTHVVTPRFGAETVDAFVLTWNREPRTLDGRAIPIRQEVSVRIRDLTPAARESIHRLNGLAREVLGARYIEAVRAMTGGTPVPLELRRVRGFLSYRAFHKTLARRLHDTFEAYGDGRHFDIYLDEHDRELGDLRAQLANEIDTRPLFVIACTADYAEPGSISEFEFTRAEERRGSARVQIAPVIFAEPRREVWDVLQPLVRVRATEDSAVTDEGFEDMLRTILGSVDAG